MTLKILQEVVEINQQQTSIWRQLRDLDVLQPHNLYFCLEIDQPNNSPEKAGKFEQNISKRLILIHIIIQIRSVHLSSIVAYGKTSTGQLRFDKPLIFWICLVQFLTKGFVSGLGKHAA